PHPTAGRGTFATVVFGTVPTVAPEQRRREPSRASRQAARHDRSGHRERLIAAMAASIETKGYREHFDDRGACFLALFDATNEDKLEQIATAVRPDQPWEQQLDDAIGAYMDT